LLTSDLVRAGTKDGRLQPRYLAPKDRLRLREIATSVIATYARMVGATRAELDEAAQAIPFSARDRTVVLGLRKLCDDRTVLEQESPLDPETVRRELFAISAREHKGASDFDRASVLAEAARSLQTSEPLLERAMFADLREAQAVKAFEPLGVDELFDDYDVSLAQAVLLRATSVTVSFADARPHMVRNLFRAARFHGLLHVIERKPKTSGWIVKLDGPYSLFESVQKYGLRLAMFLPSALALESFEISANVLWGTDRAPLELRLSNKDGLRPVGAPRGFVRQEVQDLATAFAALGSDWDVADNDRIIVAKDGSAIVPDLVFCSRSTGEEVFLEVFGFWSRAAVWRRVEQIQAGLPGGRLILAVSKQARVSEEALAEGDGGSSVLVFKSAISAKEVLARLTAGAAVAKPGKRADQKQETGNGQQATGNGKSRNKRTSPPG